MTSIREALQEASEELGVGLKDDAPEPQKEEIANDEPEIEVQPDADTDDEKQVEPENKLPEEKKAEIKTPEAQPDRQAQPVEPIQPPQFWKAEHREHFAKAPPEVQKAILDYEQQRNQWANRVANEAREARTFQKQFGSVIEPHLSRLKVSGVQPVEAIDKLLRWSDILDDESTRVDGFNRLLATYGLTPEHLMQQGQEGSSVDPVYSQINSELSELKAWKEEQLRAREEQQQQQQAYELQNEIATIQSEKDRSGNPAFPRFDVYSPHMAQIIPQLREAYPMATNVDLIRAAYTHVDQQLGKMFPSAQPQSTQPDANAQRIERAKKAASLNVKSKPSIETQSRPKNIREALSEAYAELSGA